MKHCQDSTGPQPADTVVWAPVARACRRCSRSGILDQPGGAHGLAMLLVVLGLIGLSGCVNPASRPAPVCSPLALDADDRIMILAPHPDDEALACAGVIRQARAMNLPVQIVFLTYGDNNELSFMLYRKYPVLAPREVKQMGEMRHGEALQAGSALGLTPDQLVFLGYPDFGTLHIWMMYWNSRQPFQSMLTRVTEVPYADAFRPGAPYHAEEILADLTALLRQFRPTKVFVSHPADRNPDHLALYLFTQVACWNLEKEMHPSLLPYLVHYAGWPLPSGWHPDGDLLPPELLDAQAAWQTFSLAPAAVLEKRRAIEAHRSQCAYSEKYLLSFARRNELFGAFPVITLSDLVRMEGHGLDEDDTAHAMSDMLNEEERIRFTEISQRALRYEQGQLVLTLRFSRPLIELVQASVFCFGYRSDRPFATMPKLHIKIGANLHECYDQKQKLAPQSVTLERHFNIITVRIPVKTLGDPQRILLSAMTSREEIPMDVVSWRVVELRSLNVSGTN